MLKSGTFALDSTIIETKPNFPGCGKTKRKKEGRPNDPPEYEYIHGFKLFALYEVKSRIIVAMNIVPANESDHNHFLSVIKKGIHNCGKDKIQVDNKNTNGSPLNAVVVTTWRGKNIAPEKQTVFLTSLPAEKDAAAIAKDYRLRSLIENCGFRELKQASFLKNLPRRYSKNAKNIESVENAAYLHIMLCVFAHSLFYAFLGWRKKQAPKQSDGDCFRAWRREESIKNGSSILDIAEEKYYAIYKLSELLDILGVEQKYKLQMNC